MKKSLFLAVFCFGLMTVASAQNQYVATLQHGDAVTNFYGTDALKKAHEAAETGDVVTLSAGTFSSCTIEKGITVRGAGLNSELKTEINGDFTIYSRDASWTTEFEGVRLNNTIYCSIDDSSSAGKILFEKCYLYYFYMWPWASSESSVPVVMLNNDVVRTLSVGSALRFTANNSFFGGDEGGTYVNTSNSDYSNPTFYNCVFSGHVNEANYANLNNCIICNTESSWASQLPSTSVASNCLGINSSGVDIFEALPAGASINNSMETDVTAIFKTFTGEFSGFDELYELKAKGKAYKGNDGTEVGMQGGLLPYTLQVKYPVISKFQADSRTSNDGKLNVTIEVTKGK